MFYIWENSMWDKLEENYVLDTKDSTPVTTGNNSSENKKQLQEDLDGKLSPQEKIQQTLNKLKKWTPEEVENIIKATPVEILPLVYKNSQYIKLLRSLPFENKITIIEFLGENQYFLDAVRQWNQVDTEVRINIKREFFGSNLNSENKKWIKKIITSWKESRDLIYKIEKYFV